jgi:aryl-alcohol dehydrogenase-like predicted oxidoreductase
VPAHLAVIMEATIRLGATELRLPPLGVGVWAWGDRFWSYGTDYGRQEVGEAFRASLAAGLTFFDTAELYGRGLSERLLGELARSVETPITIASKFAPLPQRWTAASVHRALAGSLARLGVSRIDLYQVHWYLPIIGIRRLMEALADAVAAGTIRAVGVSNYSAAQMREAHAALARRGIPLASNQVEYSLLERGCERNGVLAACRELGVALIAYSPLAKGRLTGSYCPGSSVRGTRRFLPSFSRRRLAATLPTVELLARVGVAHGKSPAQVALRWLLQQPSVLPIPGAKNATQATENAGALGWELTEEELAALDRATQTWR